jgi:hypothetical protein
MPGLRWVILIAAVLAAVVLASGRVTRTRPVVAAVALALGVIAALAGPAAYAVATDGSAHTGGGPLVGPPQADGGHGGGHGGWNANVENADLDTMLRNTHTKWSAAIERSNNAASLELATGTSVMAIGGFSGTDPTPTLAQFQDDVAHHLIGYYVTAPSGGRRPGWNPGSHGDITRWVAANFTATKVGADMVYDLSTH